jgi:hypothetical protein
MAMAKTVVALLDNPDEALKAVDELLQSGFQKKDIGVIIAKEDVPAEFKAVIKDMGKGAAVGALTGLLVAATTAIIPGFGALLVAGPAAALLAGLAYGSLAGGIIGALTSKGVPEEHAHAYAEGLRRGGGLMTVHAENDERVQRGVDVMKRHGALKLDERMQQWKDEGWSGRFDEKKAPAKATAEAPLPTRHVLSAVEVYSMVIELPERRRSKQRYSGEERRQLA